MLHVVRGDVDGGGETATLEGGNGDMPHGMEAVIHRDDQGMVRQGSRAEPLDGFIERQGLEAIAAHRRKACFECPLTDEHRRAESNLIAQSEAVVTQNLQAAARQPRDESEQTE